MNLLIAGGTGFIGQKIVDSMAQQGHHIYILTRSLNHLKKQQQINYITWLNKNENIIESLPHIDVVINLAGDPLNNGRWTKEKKERIYKSRKETTEKILRIMKNLHPKPSVFINASAIGIYGYGEKEQFTEETEPMGDGFLADVCMQWEKQALQARDLGIRTVITRIGIVLSKDGGALPRMALPYHLYAGGRVASGKQWMSWIHIDDLIQLIHFIIQTNDLYGPVNLTSPNPVQMDELGKSIGKALHKPHWLPVPSIALKLIFGEMSELLIKGHRVFPKKALQNGYRFKYSHIDEALQKIYSS